MGPSVGAVHKVNDVGSKTQQKTGTCYRCNGDNHLAKCHNCGKVGHIKRACRMKNMGKVKTKHVKGETGKFSKGANFMQEEGEDSDEEEVFTMYHMKDSDITINNMQQDIVIPREEPIRKC